MTGLHRISNVRVKTSKPMGEYHVAYISGKVIYNHNVFSKCTY